MLLKKRSVRLCPRILTLLKTLHKKIRGQQRSEAGSAYAVQISQQRLGRIRMRSADKPTKVRQIRMRSAD